MSEVTRLTTSVIFGFSLAPIVGLLSMVGLLLLFRSPDPPHFQTLQALENPSSYWTSCLFFLDCSWTKLALLWDWPQLFLSSVLPQIPQQLDSPHKTTMH